MFLRGLMCMWCCLGLPSKLVFRVDCGGGFLGLGCLGLPGYEFFVVVIVCFPMTSVGGFLGLLVGVDLGLGLVCDSGF